MRSPSRCAAILVVLAVAFVLLSIAVTISRSLIPHRLEGIVADVEVRHEKHPGVDDVWLIHLENGRSLHVDATIATQLREDALVRKSAGEATLSVDGERVPLTLSDDAAGMLRVMPLTLLCAVGATLASLRSTGRPQ